MEYLIIALLVIAFLIGVIAERWRNDFYTRWRDKNPRKRYVGIPEAPDINGGLSPRAARFRGNRPPADRV